MQSKAALVLTPVLLAAVLANLSHAREQAEKRTWNEMAYEVQSYWIVRIVLTDGTVLRGRSAQFNNAELRMRVEKSSNARLHPKAIIYHPPRTGKSAGF
jgi:hypothetical protein